MQKILLTICSVALAFTAFIAHAATLAPSLVEISANRGEVVEQVVRIMNTEATEKEYYMGTMKFQASPDGSTPSFVAYETDHSGLPEWISFPVSQVTVPARSFVDVPYKVAVPTDVVAGGYYAAVTISASPSDVVASNGAIIEAKTAQLVLLTVKGETRTQAVLLDFTSDKTESVQTSLAGTYQYRVQNQGNVHIQPQGTVRFTDLFGRTLLEVDANPDASRVLPGTTRTYTVVASGSTSPFALGPVHATLSLSYGADQHIQSVQSFWYVSLPTMIGLILLLGLSVLLIKRVKRS